MKLIVCNGKDEEEFLNKLKSRSEEIESDVQNKVIEIIGHVKKKGDKALKEYTLRFDKVHLDIIKVSEEEIEEAYSVAPLNLVNALKGAYINIKDFHENQKQKSWFKSSNDGVIMGQTVRPLDIVGIYVPGGTAAYPSSVLMNAVPAIVAGCEKLIMVTPPNEEGRINPNILTAAKIAGIKDIYKVGGAQAIAALAYGTESIPKVDKIVGPGNIFVATAKKCVYGVCDIDMIAGPSEVLCIADDNANPKYVAADLMSQAEHDVLASSILVTISEDMALKVIDEIKIQIKNMSRFDVIEASLEDYGVIFITKNIDEAIDIANKIAPEHLELLVGEPLTILPKIKNAGSVFLGEYSPEPLGDYYAGPNHVLPTSGTARFFSPLSVDDFIKKSSFIYYTKEALLKNSEDIITIANAEGLTAHANSIEVRKS